MEDITVRADNVCTRANTASPADGEQKKEVIKDVDQLYNNFRDFVYSVYSQSRAKKTAESDRYIEDLKSTSLEGFLAEGVFLVDSFKIADADQFARLVLSQTELDSVFEAAPPNTQEVMMKYCGYFFDIIRVITGEIHG